MLVITGSISFYCHCFILQVTDCHVNVTFIRVYDSLVLTQNSVTSYPDALLILVCQQPIENNYMFHWIKYAVIMLNICHSFWQIIFKTSFFSFFLNKYWRHFFSFTELFFSPVHMYYNADGLVAFSDRVFLAFFFNFFPRVCFSKFIFRNKRGV